MRVETFSCLLFQRTETKTSPNVEFTEKAMGSSQGRSQERSL